MEGIHFVVVVGAVRNVTANETLGTGGRGG